MYPAPALCLKCRGRKFEEVKLGEESVLVTYTKLDAVPVGIDKIPLVLGIVEFPSGARVTGQVDAKDVEIGMRLRAVWSKLRKIEGNDVYGFSFVPVQKT